MTFGVHPRGPVSGGPGPFRHAALFDAGYLTQVPSQGSDRRLWTVSFWERRTGSSDGSSIIGAGVSNNNYDIVGFGAQNDNLVLTQRIGGSDVASANTVGSYYDPTAYNHFVIIYESANSVAIDRLRIYVNGVQQAVNIINEINFNLEGQVGRAGITHAIGARFTGSFSLLARAYRSEFFYIPGHSLGPEHFGNLDRFNRWRPVAYAGPVPETHLTFDDALNLGKNSGTGGDWAVNGGVSYVADGPSINVATLQPFDINVGALSNGNLTASVSANTFARPTIAMTAGKWGTRLQFSQTGGRSYVGVSDGESSNGLDWNSSLSIASDGIEYFAKGSSQFRNGGSGFTSTHVLELMYDADTGNLRVLRDGVEIFNETEAAFIGADIRFFVGSSSGTGIAVWDFGQNGYVPSDHDYLPLIAANLPAPVVNPRERFNAVTYAGDGTDGRQVLGVGHRPSALWFKTRNAGNNHVLFDSLRGFDRRLFPSNTTTEMFRAGGIVSLDDDGFTVNHDGAHADLNGATHTYVAYSLYADPPVLNTVGSLTSQTAVAPEGHFSAYTWSGNRAGGASVGHGLPGAPEMLIHKSRTDARNWIVWHKGLATVRHYLTLNNNHAEASSIQFTAVDDRTVTFGTDSTANWTGDMVGYAFRSVPGLCKLAVKPAGSRLVYSDFKPRFWLMKTTSTVSNWIMMDTARDAVNPITPYLAANLPNGEADIGSLDFEALPNGLKINTASWIDVEALVLAMADVPFSLA